MPEQDQLITDACQAGAGVIIRGGVARSEPGAGLSQADSWRLWEASGLDDLCAEGENRTAFLLRFSISHPDMETTIVGTLQPSHLKANIQAADAGPMPRDVYLEAHRRLKGAKVRSDR